MAVFQHNDKRINEKTYTKDTPIAVGHKMSEVKRQMPVEQICTP